MKKMSYLVAKPVTLKKSKKPDVKKQGKALNVKSELIEVQIVIKSIDDTVSNITIDSFYSNYHGSQNVMYKSLTNLKTKENQEFAQYLKNYEMKTSNPKIFKSIILYLGYRIVKSPQIKPILKMLISELDNAHARQLRENLKSLSKPNTIGSLFEKYLGKILYKTYYSHIITMVKKVKGAVTYKEVSRLNRTISLLKKEYSKKNIRKNDYELKLSEHLQRLRKLKGNDLGELGELADNITSILILIASANMNTFATRRKIHNLYKAI